METLKPVQQEGRQIVIIAKCTGCNWYSSLPSTTLQMINDANLMKETALQHEKLYSHRIVFSTK